MFFNAFLSPTCLLLPAVIRYLSKGGDPLHNNAEPLVSAATNGHTHIVERLLPLSESDEGHLNALRWAAHGGHTSCVKILLSKSTQGDCNYAMVWAVEQKRQETVIALAPFCDLNAVEKIILSGVSALKHDNALFLKSVIQAHALQLKNNFQNSEKYGRKAL